MDMKRILVLLFSTTAVLASVKPDLAKLIEHSQWVITAKVIRVEGTGTEPRMVTFEKVDVIKGTWPEDRKSPTIQVDQFGKGDIDFHAMIDKPPSIFFLKEGARGLELTSAWFGVEPLTDETLARVKAGIRDP